MDDRERELKIRKTIELYKSMTMGVNEVEKLLSTIDQLRYSVSDLKEQLRNERGGKTERISPSEAIFGFASWLTCRAGSIAIGSSHEAGVMAELADEWCRANILAKPRDGIYPENIIQPKT